MANYSEIDDMAEIGRLHAGLAKELKRHFKHSRTRTVSYPSGYGEFTVRFLRPDGENTFWWASTTGDTSLVNYFGHGDPKSKAWLYIDVQINFPRNQFDRRHAGAFVRHNGTGEYVLAHRAIVTRGKSRVPKDKFFAEASVTVEHVASKAGMRNMILVSPVSSDELVENLWVFSQEVRRAADAAMHPDQSPGAKKKPKGPGDDPLGQKLREYFDEFGGRKKLPARGAATADCQHGPVVRALRDAISDKGVCLKSVGIDLVLDAPKEIVLFEVKTSAESQSLYTAVGQLFVHAIVLSRQLKGRPIQKVIVGPIQSRAALLAALKDDLDIRYLQYVRDASGKILFPELAHVL